MQKNRVNGIPIVAGTLLAAVLLFSMNAHASITMQWRALHYATLTDSSNSATKEDLYTDNGPFATEADFMEAAVFRYTGSGWETLARGYMTYLHGDGKYYFDQFVSAERGDLLRFRLYSRLKYQNRMVMIMKDSATWTSRNRHYEDFDFTVPTSWPDGGAIKTVAFTFPNGHKSFSAAVVVRELLRNYDTLDYPESAPYGTGTRTVELYINQQWSAEDSAEDCWAIFFSGYATELMSNSDYLRMGLCVRPYGGDGAVAIEKFQLGHEIGHALAWAQSGPLNTNYDADVNSVFDNVPALCQCPSTGSGHCIQSREFISSAQGESFATFIGTALMNDRDSTAWFNYYKSIYYDPDGAGSLPLATYSPPRWLNWADQSEWMRTNCLPTGAGVGGLGAEWDWIQFFWQIWAAGTSSQKLSVEQINDVWRETGVTLACCLNASTQCALPYLTGGEWACRGGTLTPLGRLWDTNAFHPSGSDSLVDSAFSELDFTKFSRFTGLGSTLGVNGEP